MTSYPIGSKRLTLSGLQHIIAEGLHLSLTSGAEESIIKCRTYLNQKIAESDEAIYGINTGFGYLQNVVIPDDQLTLLQHNLLLSHACGTGELVPKEIIKLMILLKINDCTIRMDKAIRMFVKGLKAFSSGISINSLAKGSIKSKLTL